MKHTLEIVGRATIIATTLLIAAPGTALAQQRAATSYYVDCSATANGAGTRSNPFNSTAAVNAHAAFTAGSQILLRAGTTCTGSLAPKGSGSAGTPIVLGAYGSGAKPIVKAAAGEQTALTLTDQSWWIVTGLEFSGGTRRGVFVTVTTGVARGIVLTDLSVHDVGGSPLDSKDTGLVVVSPTHDATNTTGARFDGVLVDSVVAYGTTMWAGIIVGTGTDADSWAWDETKRSTNAVVRNSTVHDVYGDGIVLFAVNNGLLDHNVAHDTGLEPTKTIGTPVGIWSWSCNTCVVQRNEVYRTESPGTDGGAFDIDFWSRNTTVQYNYGHDNSSYCIGFFAAFNIVNTDSVFRYNVCAHNGTEPDTVGEDIYLVVWENGTFDGIQIYGNTFVTDRGLIRAYSYNMDGSLLTGSLPRLFENNIVYATTADPLGAGPAILPSDYNVWYSTAGAWNTGEPHSIYADPQLTDPAHTGAGDPGNAYNLRSTSPAVDAGATIADAGPRDFRGNPVPRGNAFDIGAVESPYAR